MTVLTCLKSIKHASADEACLQLVLANINLNSNKCHIPFVDPLGLYRPSSREVLCALQYLCFGRRSSSRGQRESLI